MKSIILDYNLFMQVTLIGLQAHHSNKHLLGDQHQQD